MTWERRLLAQEALGRLLYRHFGANDGRDGRWLFARYRLRVYGRYGHGFAARLAHRRAIQQRWLSSLFTHPD